MRKSVAISVVMAVLLLGGCARAPDGIVFALKPDKDPDRMLQERAALEAFLSERVEKPVSVIIPLSGSVFNKFHA